MITKPRPQVAEQVGLVCSGQRRSIEVAELAQTDEHFELHSRVRLKRIRRPGYRRQRFIGGGFNESRFRRLDRKTRS